MKFFFFDMKGYFRFQIIARVPAFLSIFFKKTGGYSFRTINVSAFFTLYFEGIYRPLGPFKVVLAGPTRQAEFNWLVWQWIFRLLFSELYMAWSNVAEKKL